MGKSFWETAAALDVSDVRHRGAVSKNRFTTAISLALGRSQGLNHQSAFRAATDEYSAAEDLLGRWLAEQTIQDAR